MCGGGREVEKPVDYDAVAIILSVVISVSDDLGNYMSISKSTYIDTIEIADVSIKTPLHKKVRISQKKKIC